MNLGTQGCVAEPQPPLAQEFPGKKTQWVGKVSGTVRLEEQGACPAPET